MTSTNGESPTFSVIMIFQNEERFLADAVASVSSQVGPTWELILVDDGSTDRSGDIARTLATSDRTRIRYVSHPGGSNRGMSASRNLGIGEARGRWITFLDADDTWTAGKLAAQLDLLDQHHDVGVLVSPACWWRSWNPDTGKADWLQDLLAAVGPPISAPDPERTVDHRVVAPPQLVTVFLTDEWNSICDLVVHCDVIAAVGGYETPFTGMFEDQVFHTKVLSRFAAVVTRDSWYRYRQHDSAVTAASHAAGTHVEARHSFLRWAFDHLTTVDRPEMVETAEWRGLIDSVRTQRRHAGVRLLRQRLPRRPAWLR